MIYLRLAARARFIEVCLQEGETMLTRYTGMTAKNQSYLFTVGLVLTILGMALTDMWLPMVAGALILTGLTVESWIRVAYIIPMHNEMRAMKQQLNKLSSELHTIEHEQTAVIDR